MLLKKGGWKTGRPFAYDGEKRKLPEMPEMPDLPDLPEMPNKTNQNKSKQNNACGARILPLESG
ncbi:MAG: hypothetical protein IJ418_15810 [Clostridia bacterium]|nr:hypothetical protein [Clostridia bacterium]